MCQICSFTENIFPDPFLSITDATSVFFIAIQIATFSIEFFHFGENFRKKPKFFEHKNSKFWNLKIRRFTGRVFWFFWRRKNFRSGKYENKNTGCHIIYVNSNSEAVYKKQKGFLSKIRKDRRLQSWPLEKNY